MGYILQIETSTDVCSVAISFEGQTLGVNEIHQPNIHASKLTVFIQDLLSSLSLQLGDMKAVAVSSGPGSYTGLRIGLSVAKGIAFALDIPIIGIDTLQALANGARESHQADLYCPMIDARRMEVYTAFFDNEGKQIKETSAMVLDSDSFADYLQNNTIVFVGNGVDKWEKVCVKNSSNAIFSSHKICSAKDMSSVAYDKYKKGETEDLSYFTPIYLKPFVTQSKFQK